MVGCVLYEVVQLVPQYDPYISVTFRLSISIYFTRNLQFVNYLLLNVISP